MTTFTCQQLFPCVCVGGQNKWRWDELLGLPPAPCPAKLSQMWFLSWFDRFSKILEELSAHGLTFFRGISAVLQQVLVLRYPTPDQIKDVPSWRRPPVTKSTRSGHKLRLPAGRDHVASRWSRWQIASRHEIRLKISPVVFFFLL